MLSVTSLWALLGLSDTLGYILLMDVQNKLRSNTDTHRYNSKFIISLAFWWRDSKCSSQERSLVVTSLPFTVCAASVMTHCKTEVA